MTGSLTLSLWLPVLRANFFSFSSRAWLHVEEQDEHSVVYTSRRLNDLDYKPLLYVPVLRRLLEVMPRSFHYDPKGTCRISGTGELIRPTTVVMMLVIAPDIAESGDSPAARANAGLRDAGVSAVELYADENGNYAFTANFADADEATVRAALIRH